MFGHFLQRAKLPQFYIAISQRYSVMIKLTR